MRSPAAKAAVWVTSEQVTAALAVVIVHVTAVAAPFLRTV
jgi:preprotein translocase subunit SecE